MKELKPAHEVVVGIIESHCKNIAGVKSAISAGGIQMSAGFMSAEELEDGRLLEIGGLSSQIRGLEAMIIPPDKLQWVVDRLKQLDRHHAGISALIGELASRQKEVLSK
jgi:hypothetical protein